MEDQYKTNYRKISDNEWMTLLRDRPNLNFLNEGPEPIPIRESKPEILESYLTSKSKKKSQGISPLANPTTQQLPSLQKLKKGQYSLEL